MKKKICLDTSIIIDKKVPELIEKRKVKEVIIPYAALDELQAQASKGREEGFIGLEELKRIREVCKKRGVQIKFAGQRPTLEDIKLARSGRIDAIIRDVAKTEKATLVTADYVQALVAEAEGVDVLYIPADIKTINLTFEEFFDSKTMSVHLKEGVPPYAKRGKPGKFKLVKLRDKPLTREEIENIIKEIVEAARVDEKSSFEIIRNHAMVIQFQNYRIAIARPPFSDGLEVTIVKPIVKLRLEDYKLSERLLKRLKEKAEGILVCGPPGSGKSTFVSALVEFYLKQGKIIKTLESPRDLQVPDEVTQYTPLEGSFEKTADILLLVRPDYTAFDEVRKTQDFEIFVDMRLAGVGMIGVVHASKAIDAVQRFLSRVELGMLPHIVDTVIFIKNGGVDKVYTLEITVKVPSGMTEEDLSRPVVEVRDFETGKLEYEIYTYGEENVVVPVKEEKPSGIRELARQRIYQIIRKFDKNAGVEIVSDHKAIIRVDNKKIPRIIGREGSVIKKLEEMLGISLEVEPRIPTLGNEVKFETDETGNSIEFKFKKNIVGKLASFYVDDKFIFSATVGKKNKIKVSKNSELGRKILKIIASNKKIKAFI
ncbi:MAG: Flp pilus assembly complex ATPase component TadA [Candidatus Aenigmarchaeota archaeon]|nr:Flp pilus assembly complex ATPase component TadA [Candidatus Aenigmarchaeota archaeon]